MEPPLGTNGSESTLVSLVLTLFNETAQTELKKLHQSQEEPTQIIVFHFSSKKNYISVVT